jgi:hypothetical protein
MAKVIISKDLKNEIFKKFKDESIFVFNLMKTLEINPQKGKNISHISEVIIKELKYKKFRFYCITNGRILKFGTEEELTTLIIKFVKMSEKKDQQKIIEQIKEVLRKFGFDEV